MVALVSFLLVLTLSLIIECIAAVALILTGLFHNAAAFQVRSAFTGTGFTTSEAEQVVGHPARRRIIMVLMGVRSFEIITGVSTPVILFLSTAAREDGVVQGRSLVASNIVPATERRWTRSPH